MNKSIEFQEENVVSMVGRIRNTVDRHGVKSRALLDDYT